MATAPSFGYGVAGHKNSFSTCSGALVGNWVEEEFGRSMATQQQQYSMPQSEFQSAYGEVRCAEKSIPVSHEGLSAELMFHHTFNRGDEPSLKIGTIHDSLEKTKAREESLARSEREIALRRSEALASTQNVEIRHIPKKEEDDPLPNFRRRKTKRFSVGGLR